MRFPTPSELETADALPEHPEPETLSDIGAQLGEEHEALRNLLVDAGRRIADLDETRVAFAKLVEPANKALRALEQEKAHNIGLRRTLDQTRRGYERLQESAALERDNEQIRQEIELLRHSVRELENGRAEAVNELAIKRAEIAELERQRAQDTAQVRALTEDNQTLRDDVNAGAKRVGQLEAEITIGREKLLVAQGENRSLRASYEQTAGEIGRASQRLVASENAAGAARTRIVQLESALAEAESDRKRLAIALEEANERHRAEQRTFTMQLGAVQARAAATENLLAETRQIGIARSEEARVADRQAMEAVFAFRRAQKKLGDLEAANKALETQVRELEQSRATLIERSGVLINTLKSREAQLARAEEKVQSVIDHLSRLEGDTQIGRTMLDKRIEELTLTLERERLEHSVAQGALEAARKDRADLQRELQKMHETLRRGNRLSVAPISAPDPIEQVPAESSSNSTAPTIQPLAAPGS